MPEIPDVVPGTPIEAGSWGNPVRSRTLQRYASAAARDASVPVPGSGELSWLDDVDSIEVFDGVAWLAVTALDGGPFLPLTAGSANPLTDALYIAGGPAGLRISNPTPAGDAYINLGHTDFQNSSRYGYVGGVGGVMRLQAVNNTPLQISGSGAPPVITPGLDVTSAALRAQGGLQARGGAEQSPSGRVEGNAWIEYSGSLSEKGALIITGSQRANLIWDCTNAAATRSWRMFAQSNDQMRLEYSNTNTPVTGWTLAEAWSPTAGVMIPVAAEAELAAHPLADPEVIPLAGLLADLLARIAALELAP